ncbi:MAG TPA: D-alanyl-D-alanine carboxypeptidase family protein [Limnochordia bacterium]|nr:D-alanyl-D-alanine carboxypeptidase family protein [Limnochordia bacterium]
MRVGHEAKAVWQMRSTLIAAICVVMLVGAALTGADRPRVQSVAAAPQLFASVPQAAVTAIAPPEFNLHAKSGILMDAASGSVFYEFNADTPLPPASITKIMTLLLGVEAVERGDAKLTDLVTASDYAVSMGGAQIWLEPGESMPLGEILNALAVGSANDAAVALAEHLAGTKEAFVDEMNAKAQALGMKATHFVNPSGLPPSSLGESGEHVMSARDIAVLSRYAMRYKMFRNLVGQYGPLTMRPETKKQPILYNFNRMLATYDGMDGIKTGFTNESGYSISASATRQNLRLIAVVMGAPSAKVRNADVASLLNWGFAHYRAAQVAAAGKTVAQIDVRKGKQRSVPLLAADDLNVTRAKGDKQEITTEIAAPKALVAPVKKGQAVGELIAKVGDQEVGRVPLIAGEDIERAGMLQIIWNSLTKILGRN